MGVVQSPNSRLTWTHRPPVRFKAEISEKKHEYSRNLLQEILFRPAHRLKHLVSTVERQEPLDLSTWPHRPPVKFKAEISR